MIFSTDFFIEPYRKRRDALRPTGGFKGCTQLMTRVGFVTGNLAAYKAAPR
jgi:hypothetical protein